MSAELLVRRFAQVTETPNAIARLRRFLIDLAVSGRLGDDRDKPIRIGWPYAPLGDLVDLRYGKGLAQADRTPEGPVAVYGSNGIVARTHTALADAPSIIVGRKGSAGALRMADEPSWTTDVAYYIEPPPSFDIRFLFFALQSLRLESLGKGVKPGLSRSDAYPLLLPQPPLTDQRRIVAKVDELMALCDELEAAQTHREARRDRLRATSLRNLVAPDKSKDYARFFLRHSARMITKPEHVAGVRQAILDLAVRGRLVAQDPEDEPFAPPGDADTTSSSRRTRDSRGLTTAEIPPFDIPLEWHWASLGRVSTIVRGITFAAADKSKVPLPGHIACLRSGNVQAGVTWSNLLYVPRSVVRSGDQLVREDDILISIANSYALVGKCAIAVGVPFEAAYGAFLAAIRVCDDDPRYVAMTLTASYSGEAFRRGSAQTTNIANITFGYIRGHPIPLPPLAEQHRIVAQVDELMAVCDELERSLAREQTERGRLLEALLRDALEDALPARELEPLGAR